MISLYRSHLKDQPISDMVPISAMVLLYILILWIQWILLLLLLLVLLLLTVTMMLVYSLLVSIKLSTRCMKLCLKSVCMESGDTRMHSTAIVVVVALQEAVQ